jgi:hypothetical protein
MDAVLAEDDDSDDAVGTDEDEEEEEVAEALYSDEDSTEVRRGPGTSARMACCRGGLWQAAGGRRRPLLHSC